MAWLREPLDGPMTLDDYVSGALTVGTLKKEWVVDQPCEIKGVRVDSGGAGAGAGSSTIDVLVNGVTIFTGGVGAPTIATASTGDWTVGASALVSLKAGDVISYSVTAIPATSGHTRTKLAIELERT